MPSSAHPRPSPDPRDFPSPWVERFTPLFLVPVAVGVFLNSIANGFAYDDVLIVQTNPLIRDFRNLPDMFLSEYWGRLFGGRVAYRPILMLSLAIAPALFGSHPAGYHIVNVGLHAACVPLLPILAVVEPAPKVGRFDSATTKRIVGTLRSPGSFDAGFGMVPLDVAEHHDAAARPPIPDAGRARVHAPYAEVPAAGEADAALEQAQTAAETSPASALAWTQLGDAHLARGNSVAALTAYDRAVARDPDFPQAHNNRGVLLMRAGRLTEAEREFETVPRLDPEALNARKNLDPLRQRRSAAGTP